MTPQNITRIFICYSQDDFSARGIELRDYLSKTIPNSDVYIDQSKTKGQNWRKINDWKLNKAEIVLVILTPAALQSTEVSREVEISKKLQKRIIPCKDDSLGLEWKKIPWDLDQLDGITFSNKIEVLKTDLYREITKIIKELLGIKPSQYSTIRKPIMTPVQIEQKMWSKKMPEWLGHHDHLSSIPNTKSFVFYPYNENEADEKYLNKIYEKYGYKVIVRPKSESEYNSAQHQTYKVLILEPDFDEQKIVEGCDLIAQYYRYLWTRQGLDLLDK